MKSKKMIVLVVVTMISALSTTSLLAISHHFPNTACANSCNVDQAEPSSGTFGLALVLYDRQNKSPERIPAIPINPDVTGWTGERVAAEVANAVCESAKIRGWTCPAAPPANPCDHTIPVDGGDEFLGSSVECTKGNNRFTITQAANSDGAGEIGTDVVIDKTGGPWEITSSLFYNVTVGNANGPDLLRIVLAQVSTNGVNGTVTFRAFHNQGGTNPRTFSVNTASFATSEALHAAIKSGFEGLGLGLTVDNLPTSEFVPKNSGDSTKFAPGNFIIITNAERQVTRVDADGVPGQSLVMETGGPDLIPTLSEWAMISLIGLLLASGVWMLRRFPLGN